MTDEIILRIVTPKDAGILLKWRNDPNTRRASHNIEKIDESEHISWLLHSIDDPNRKLYIAEQNGVPLGTVRADLSDDIWELSWALSPEARGRGVAKQMVAKLANQISGQIRAEVKKGNIASSKIAEYAGMVFQNEVNGILHYSRSILR